MWVVQQKGQSVLWYAEFKSIIAVKCRRHTFHSEENAPKALIQWMKKINSKNWKHNKRQISRTTMHFRRKWHKSLNERFPNSCPGSDGLIPWPAQSPILHLWTSSWDTLRTLCTVKTLQISAT